MNEYAAIIIAYRDLPLVHAVIRQLANQTLPPQVVIVVDNGGTITASDINATVLGDRVVLVPREDNPGYGAAVNEARGRCTSPALLVLTHDASFGSDLAEQLLASLSTNDTAGAVAPVLNWVSNPDSVFSAGGRLSSGGRASNRTSISSAAAYPVDWVDGAIVMYRVKALDSVEWLAEHYFLYFEDVDTAWRMRQAGWDTLVNPKARALQQPGAHPMYLGIRNMTLFARMARIPFVPHLFAVGYRVAEETAAGLLRKRSPHLIAAWKGWRDGRRGITGKPKARA